MKIANENNLRKLMVISEMLGSNNFYSLRVTCNEITLQGKYDSKLVHKLNINKKYKFIGKDDSGYLQFRRSNIKIVLT